MLHKISCVVSTKVLEKILYFYTISREIVNQKNSMMKPMILFLWFILFQDAAKLSENMKSASFSFSKTLKFKELSNDAFCVEVTMCYSSVADSCSE